MSNFMNRQSFKQMSSLVNKYRKQGLTIDVEFGRWGLTIRGILDISYGEIVRFKREYFWEYLEDMPEEIGLEFLIDEFKKEFEKNYSIEI